MTLIQLIELIKTVSLSKPNINFFGEGDIYTLNSNPSVNYSLVFVTQGTHTLAEDTSSFNLNIFYVDRLEDDFDNRLLIQSNGIEALKNIINTLINEYDVVIDGDIRFTSFNQRFTDNCAGVFCNLTIITDSNLGYCGYE